MKNRILMIAAIASISMIACNKEEGESYDLADEIAEEETQIRLSQSDFEMVVVEDMQRAEGSDEIVSGVVNYVVNGTVEASIDYGTGAVDGEGVITEDGEEKDFKCDKDEEIDEKKDDCGCGDKDGKKDWKKDGKKKYGKKKPCFKKIVVEPIVKTEDCDYPVAGVIKFIDKKTDEWVATIDFGDGECDDIATKTTADGEHTFLLKKHKK